MVECNTQHNLKEQQSDLGYLQRTLAAADSAFDNALYPKALEHYQSVIRDIDTVLPFKILMQCARAHQAVGELELAVDDVLKAIGRYPIEPRGYLLAADLYLKQDMLRDALLICDEGCANANIDMAGYKDLQSMRRKVLHYVLVRNSWISERLSGEIIDQILSLLPIKSQVQLAMTCKHWNTYVFRFWPGLWNTVRLTCLGDQKEHLLSTIPGHKVRHLIIDAGMPWNARERLITNKWDQLESLVYAEGDVAPWNWFQQLIGMNKTTLKRVELYESETVRYSKGWMYLVLSACPKLETFRCVGYKDSPSGSVLMPTTSISLADYQLLASLTLPLVRISTTSPSIARCLPEILPHCPYLEEISFDDYDVGLDNHGNYNNERLLCQMLTAIDRHCPMIKKVEINPQPSPYEHWHPTMTSSGLQSLSFQLSMEQYSDNQSDQILTSFIERHHTTLGRISIVYNGTVPWLTSRHDGRPMRYLHRLGEFDIPRVRDLRIAQEDDGYTFAFNINQSSLLIRTAHSIIQRCHSLEYLQLIDCFDAEVLQTIADKLDRQPLRVLRLVKHEWDQCEQRGRNEKHHRDMAVGSLCRVFDDHTMKLLSIVDLDMGPWVDNRVLKAIGRNDKHHQHVLTRLRIGKGNKITSDGFLDFAKDMQQSQLAHLSIDLRNDDGTKRIDDILEFATLPYLTNVDISANCKYLLARSAFARYFSASRNTTRLKISYTGYEGAYKYHLVYTCRGMGLDAYMIDIQCGPYTYEMHVDLHGDVVLEDPLALFDSNDGSDGSDSSDSGY